jgi:hypothetical protein
MRLRVEGPAETVYTIDNLRKELSRQPYRHSRAMDAISKFDSMDQLLATSESQLMSLRGLGRKTLRKIKEALARHDMKLAPDPINSVSFYRRVDLRLAAIEYKVGYILDTLLEMEKTK